MKREIKRLCTPCAGKLQDAGIGCRRMEDAGGSTGTCSGCDKHRLCFTWEVTYKGTGETPHPSGLTGGHLPPEGEGYTERRLK